MADVNIDTEFLDAINDTPLIGSRVYPKRFPQSPTFPCATYTRISAVPERAFNRALGEMRTRFQVDIWAQSHTQARQAAAQMRAAILGFYGTVVTVFGLDDANESDTVNPDNGLHQTSIDVVISHAD